jgi:hypothetical protein
VKTFEVTRLISAKYTIQVVALNHDEAEEGALKADLCIWKTVFCHDNIDNVELISDDEE